MNETTELTYRPLTEASVMAKQADTAWNVTFTNLIRNTDRYAWGNWTLDPTIELGAVGWFNLTDFQLQSAGSTFDAPCKSMLSNTDWHVEQGKVKQTSTGIKFDVPYKDPTTGLEVTVGTEATWSFESAGSMSSQGTTTRIDVVEDPASFMLDQYDAFLALAERYNQAQNGKIAQGFGMITKVWLTTGCVNAGSRSDKSSLSVAGSVEGMAAMIGRGASAALNGSYARVTSEGSIEQRIFPGKANVVVDAPVPYAYEFSSFDGRVVIPRWITNIPYLSLWLDNGGTYIVKATVTYEVDGKKQERKASVSGGLDTQINDIPLNATNLVVEMDFVAGGDHFLQVQSPLSAWYRGRGHIKLKGVWPGKTSAEWID